MSVGANIQIPPFSALERTVGCRVQHRNKLDQVGVDTHFSTCTDAEDIKFGLGTALHTDSEVCLESRLSGIHRDWQGLAADAIARYDN